MILMNIHSVQVIARIFYCVNRSWSGRISVAELRRSNLLSVIAILEHEEDINQVTAYFSYEHFYVIYCKFWELDRDHDLFIDKTDLTKHNDHGKKKKNTFFYNIPCKFRYKEIHFSTRACSSSFQTYDRENIQWCSDEGWREKRKRRSTISG